VRALPVVGSDVASALVRDDGVDAAWPEAPPWPHAPTLEWQVLGRCNYDCSYCIQSKKHRQGEPTPAQLLRALSFFATLPEPFEVKTTGGEPFALKAFLDVVVPGLMASRHTLSTLTNLSAPPATLKRFAALTFGRLHVVSASLHLEHTTPQEFLSRLRVLHEHVDARTRLVVNAVLVPANLPAVRAAQRLVQDAGFTFYPQLMKVKHGVYAYSKSELRWVDEITGGLAQAALNRTANTAPAYTGRACYTGSRYAVVTKEGDVFSCRSARRFGEGFLGNIHDGSARLRSGARACRYTLCPCAVPANRGMIEGVPLTSNAFAAEET
jgi:MoaA/NifB/PqqE/SkfB family radical SAM enzyme